MTHKIISEQTMAAGMEVEVPTAELFGEQPPTAINRSVMVPQHVVSPLEMENIQPHMRMAWKINQIISKGVHELFQCLGPEDAAVIKGKHTDHAAMKAAGEAFSAAGWITAILRPEDHNADTTLIIARTPMGLKMSGVDQQALINHAASLEAAHGPVHSTPSETPDTEPGTTATDTDHN